MTNNGLKLIAPRITPVLDPDFRPASLANRAFRDDARASGAALPIKIAIEQADGSTFQFETVLFDERHPGASGNYTYLERFVKFLLWSRGGFRVYTNAPESVVEKLREHYQSDPTGKFDSMIMGERIYEKPLEILHTPEVPGHKERTAPLGRHL